MRLAAAPPPPCTYQRIARNMTQQSAFTVAQLANAWAVSERHVYNLVAAGELGLLDVETATVSAAAGLVQIQAQRAGREAA